jgi:tetratricopeptide (TPR) repeat protein
MNNRLFALLVACFLAVAGFGQQTTVYTEAFRSYKQAEAFFEQGLYAKARDHYGQVVQLLLPVNEADSEQLRVLSELGYAKAAVRLKQPDGEKLILDFIRSHSPDPIANQALIEVANYYFDSGEFEKALPYYARVPLSGLPKEEKAQVRFRMGYAQFVQKQFAMAKQNFREIKDLQTDYYYPTNYYLGLCYFYEGSYDDAVRQFRIVEKSTRYDDFIPYYLTQIFFAQRRYDELLAYAEPRLSEPSLKNVKEINQLVGQSYFEKENYTKALPFLEYYAERTSGMREEEFYQLGFTQYKTGNYEKAIRSFREVSTQNSELSQSANYYLADCYLRRGDKSSARAAFSNAKRMNYDPQITEDATFNYGKLSYELKDPREAIAALQTLGPTSRYYLEAQGLMGEVFLSYRDYQQAIDVLDKIPNKTPQLQETLQKVIYFRGLQLLQENKPEEAKVLLQRSLANPIDQRTRALALYWLADIAHQQKRYQESIQLTNQFLTLARTQTRLPDESSVFSGNYLQGYNYLKLDNYTASLDFFREAVDGIKRNRNFISNPTVRDNMLGDAVLRTGDAYFKRNQYNQAIQYYDEAVNNRYSGYIYALYQKALIEGLRGRTAEKILALERISSEYSKSEYADDALFQLGLTYQQIGQLNKAVAPLRQIVEQYKTTSDLVIPALLQLGLVSYNLGNLEAAANYYKQVFSNNPSSAEANLALAALEDIYVDDMGRADLYFAFLETVPGYKVDNLSRDSINFRAAEAQFENANYQRAIESYTDYLRQFPNGRNILTAYYHRGESYTVLKQYSQALRDYEFVISKGSSTFFMKALEKAAIIAYNHEQDFAKAYQLYSRLEQTAQDENLRFEAQLGAMRSAYRAGNNAAVVELANRVANNPRANDQQKATAQFYIGKNAYDRRDYDAALRAFNENIRLSDNEQTAEARYLKAMVYYQRRDLETAQQLSMAANKESSAYPYWVAKSVILLGDIFTDKGDLYNARAVFEALLENYKEDQTLVSEAQQKLQRVNERINQGSRLRSTDPNRLELDNGGN